MPVILMTTLFYKALILQGEIWCWSLLGLKGLRAKILHCVDSYEKQAESGADPGFFLGGGTLVSCSTSTPINHIFFLAEYQLY